MTAGGPTAQYPVPAARLAPALGKHARPRNPDGSFAGQPGPATAEGHFDESLVYDDDWHRHP